MAAPPEVNIHNMEASYDLNKNLSDSTTAMLKMQGIGFLVRQAASYSAIQANLRQYPDHENPGIIHLDQEQISTGNIRQLEPRTLDGQSRDREIDYWGKVKGWNKYAKLSEVTQDPFLTEGWAQECIDGEIILGFVESLDDTWVATQVWGFAEIDGVRRHVRKVYSRKGKQEQRIRLVYDYKGPPPAR